MGGEFIHSLGTAVPGISAVLCFGWAVASARRAHAARRRREWLLGIERLRRRTRPRLSLAGRAKAREWAMAVSAGCAIAVFIGGIPGCVAGLAMVFGVRRWQLRSRRRTRGAPLQDDRTGKVTGQLPLAAELLAACLASGAAPGAAACAVGRTLEGPLAQALSRAAAELRLGGDPAQCWSRVRALPQADVLGRWMERAGTTGVPPVAEISRLAAAYRAERSRSAGSRARRAAVLATAPLGLCFLPAFLAVGVVPVVIGLAEVMAHAQQV
ncbi:type II secretion system F family protein [Streptomyces sp. RB6PN25]|uniref:Type II secretion system F family protein n=1 Tax=Streptomyces humicola TaxID=2953240 RepID=A0ABT1PTZ5_9ACTN|nr:type II secretion system F family protein [Streptomyces humicola]MCQ4081154.1 type II secretion system F family protein [Streptomyces humicola]